MRIASGGGTSGILLVGRVGAARAVLRVARGESFPGSVGRGAVGRIQRLDVAHGVDDGMDGGRVVSRSASRHASSKVCGTRAASHARRATRWRCAHASKMPAVTAGTSSGGGPRAGFPAASAPCARGDASRRRGTCPCTWTVSDRRRRGPRNQPRRDGGRAATIGGRRACGRRRRGRRGRRRGARPARVVVREVEVVALGVARDAARACPWTHPGRSSSRRRRRARRQEKVCIDGTPRRSICFCVRNSPIKTQVLRKLVLAGPARLPATALGARRIKLTYF